MIVKIQPKEINDDQLTITKINFKEEKSHQIPYQIPLQLDTAKLSLHAELL